MPTNPNPKNYLLGGLALCAFPAVVFLAMHLNGVVLPMPWPIFFGVLVVHGVRAVMVSLLGLDLEGVFSWVMDAVATAGFAVVALWVAWTAKDGWSGGVPILPDRWDQIIPRALFGLGGLFCALAAGRCLLKAYHVYRNRPD